MRVLFDEEGGGRLDLAHSSFFRQFRREAKGEGERKGGVGTRGGLEGKGAQRRNGTGCLELKSVGNGSESGSEVAKKKRLTVQS